MPEDLLQELETAASVVVSLENIQDLLRVVARDVSCAAGGMKGSARTFEDAWQRIVLEVARGQTPAIHTARPQLLNAFTKRLEALRQTHALAAGLRQLGRADTPDPEVLVAEIAGLERLQARVFDPWRTAEDLEDLAARDYPLTTADLNQIGPQRRPPASWYAEESKPF
jgi:hypothetical protein